MKNIVFDLGRILLDYQPLVWLKKKNYTHYNELFEIIFQNPLWVKLDEGTITREEFTEKLEELKAEFDCVTERRGKGLMQGLVITKPIKEINDRAIEEGLLIIQAQGNVIRFVPPLIVEKEHIDQMVEKMRRILA